MKKILVIHGPNLNLLGEREKNIYGLVTLARINENLKKIAAAREGVLCLGTTAMRALESLTPVELTSEGLLRRCDIFIKPGFEFHHCRALWTNFHLPESTLFVLVSAFAGSLELAQEAYRHAIKTRYRFFSYGDASLWI